MITYTYHTNTVFSWSCRNSSKLSVERFYTIVQFKSLRALADPGEAVGLLAAQVSPGVTGVRTALVPYA